MLLLWKRRGHHFLLVRNDCVLVLIHDDDELVGHHVRDGTRNIRSFLTLCFMADSGEVVNEPIMQASTSFEHEFDFQEESCIFSITSPGSYGTSGRMLLTSHIRITHYTVRCSALVRPAQLGQ